MKSVFKKGFMYKLSGKLFYIAENKTLAGKEDRQYEGEAVGRKMAIIFFETAPGGMAVPTHMNQHLLSLAELMQEVGGCVVPPDPHRTAGDTELLLEAQYQDKELLRYKCMIEPEAPDLHTNSLHEEEPAEEVRCFQETLQ